MNTRTRHVIRAGLAWLALAWLTAAIANLLFPALGLPMAALRWLLLGLLAGLVVVVFVAWRNSRTALPPADATRRERTAHRLDQATVVLVLAALSLSLLHQFLQPYADRKDAAAAPVAVPAAAPAPPTLPVDPHSIAVLPFANLSPAPDDAYFADGLAEELRNVIARIDGLKVTSRSSSFQFRDGATGAGEIAARLGVAYLLEGSVRRQDEDVRITVQLVDAVSERQMWSNTYERGLGDIFGVQQEISQAVADALADSLGVREVQVAPSTQDLPAYEMYLRGRQLFVQRGANLPAARGLLEQAVARDPRFTDAWAALAGTWYVWRSYAPEPEGVDTFTQAETTAAKALALDPEHAAALAVAARIAADRGDRLREAELIGRALALAPNDANTRLWKGLGQYEAGHVAAAHASFLQARQLDPLSGLHIGWVGITTSGDRVRSTALLQEAHALGWRGPASRSLLLTALAAGDDPRVAYEAWLHDDETLPVRQRAFARSLAPALSDAAGMDSARQRLRAAVAADPGLDWIVLLQLFGLTDEAMDAALQPGQRDKQTLRLNLWHDAFAGFRAHPRFGEWAQREGLPDYWLRYGPPDGCRVGEPPAPLLACD
jgi:TolB-like protein